MIVDQSNEPANHCRRTMDVMLRDPIVELPVAISNRAMKMMIGVSEVSNVEVIQVR